MIASVVAVAMNALAKKTAEVQGPTADPALLALANGSDVLVELGIERRGLGALYRSSAYTPQLCMGTTSTVLRFFVKSSDNGSVRVEVVLRGALGQVLGVFQVSRLSPGASWQPGPGILNLDSLLGLLGVSSVQLKFRH